MTTDEPTIYLVTDFHVETIANGYLVSHRVGPSRTDPMAQREPVLFVTSPEEIGQAVDLHMKRLVQQSGEPDSVRRAFQNAAAQDRDHAG